MEAVFLGIIAVLVVALLWVVRGWDPRDLIRNRW